MKKNILHIIAVTALIFAFSGSLSLQGQITDIDGNTYNAIVIGNQTWMKENLKVTRFRDGTPITNITTPNSVWTTTTLAAYCWYDNSITNKDIYGALYNWRAVSNDNLCPTGYHMPTNDEWTTLVTFLGGELVAGGKLKETGTLHWLTPNTGANNESGFSARPGGTRKITPNPLDPENGAFASIGGGGLWWTSTIITPNSYYWGIAYNEATILNPTANQRFGMSVRCLRNMGPYITSVPITSITQTSAQSGGNISGDGGMSVTARGVCWNTSPNPTTFNNHTTDGSGIGSFVSNLTGLTPNTTYYVRAYATNSVGDSYGNEFIFSTLPCPEITATISGNTILCLNSTYPNITFTASNGIAPYTFTYKINGGSNLTISTTSGNSVNVTAPTGTAGTFTYTLVSVYDMIGSTCSQVQTGSATITVNPLPTASIGGTTEVCTGGVSPNITFLGASGTAPYTFTYKINTGPNQTISTTGGNGVNLPVPTGTAGVFTYTLISVSDANACSQSQSGSAVITVKPLPTANISYTGSPWCNTAGVQSVTLTGTTGGTYSASPAGLNIDPGTGTIAPSTSTAQTYLVTYTISAGDCGIITATSPVTITALPVATFSYLGSPFCSTAEDPLPVFTGGGVAGTFSSDAGLVFLNTVTGQIDLSASTSGPHNITNTIPAAGGCDVVTATNIITITQQPEIAFQYPAGPLCNTGPVIHPTLEAGTPPGGTYSATPEGMTINSETGDITLSTTIPGTYAVTYTIPAAGGCGVTSGTRNIIISGVPFPNVAYTGSPWCRTAGIQNVTLTGGGIGGNFTAEPVGLNLNATTGEINPELSAPGNYTVTYNLVLIGCGLYTANTFVTIIADNTITLTSTNNNQTLCINTAITNIAFTTTGATGATFTGLPAGVSGAWAANAVTISGTPTVSGLFNYIVTLTGSCGVVTTSGTITVTAQPTAPIVGTITQPTCLFATGSVILNGLPAGNWIINPGAIAGAGASFTVVNLIAGTYNFTVTTATGCISPASAGIVIAVQPTTPTAPVVGTITNPTCSVATGSVALSGLPAAGTWTLTRYPGAVTTSGTGTSANISSLPAGSYNYTVTNASGCISVVSPDIVINLQPVAPTASSAAATDVAATLATLHGTVNANNAIADITFEYGPTPGYGSSINAVPNPVTGTNPTAVSANITGLTPNTTYFYRVKAVSSGCTTYGTDLSFTTDKEYQLEYISGNNQTYPGGGLPFPMVFKIRNVTDNVYVTNLTGEGLSMLATATSGHQDAAFNNLNDYCGEGINSSCFGGYYYVESNYGPEYVLSITVALGKDNQVVSVFTITENISGATANLVTSVTDSGPGSLRNAIEYANSNPGNDIISFNIPGPGPHTIIPLSAFPNIVDQVVIDGYTQPGSSPNLNPPGQGSNAVLKIEIDGRNVPYPGYGLTIYASTCTVRGLVFNHFSHSGISLFSNHNNIIEGNYFGTDINGSDNQGFGIGTFGIQILQSNNNVIRGNIISGNGGEESNPGLMINGGSTGNQILGNFFGTDVTGTLGLPNSGSAININACAGNFIGGLNVSDRNIILGSIQITGTASTGNNIIGNYIGPDVTGQMAIGTGSAGVVIYGGASENIIGPANVISGIETGNAVSIQGQDTHDNYVIGNMIGVNSLGTIAIPNGTTNVFIDNSPGNNIGGPDTEDRNVISGTLNDHGILITGTFSTNNEVIGNYIGTNAAGTLDLGNARSGIEIQNGASGNIIGRGNLISGNGFAGIIISGQSRANQVIDNIIGTNITVDALISNGDDGVHISDASDNLVSGNVLCGAGIGGVGNNGIEILGSFASGNRITGNLIGTNSGNAVGLGNGFMGIQIKRDAHDNTIGPDNVISGNLNHGILIERDSGWPGTTSADNNKVISNRIGTSVDGKAPLGNHGCGILIKDYASNNTIGPNNVISGNLIAGIQIEGQGSKSNITIGNFIGVDVSGKLPVGNTTNGVLIIDASDNIIGGTNPGEKNVISSNGNGIYISGPEAVGNKVMGNYIGVDVSGRLPLGNAFNGLEINNHASGNIIGGTNPGEGNLISGNNQAGISINGGFSGSTENNRILGNYIGTDYTGVVPIGNKVGVTIWGGARNNMVGDIIKGGGNLIANSAQEGVWIYDNGTIGNVVISNSIHSNGGLGIDLGNKGVTPNDNNDTDIGPNNLQNFPVIDSLNYTSSSVYIRGRLNSAANSGYTLEFFANKVADNTGYGEGRTYLGSKTVTTNSSGNATFSENFSRSTGWGDVITATATDAQGNTSEFSEAVGGLRDQIIAPANWPFHFRVNEDGILRITNGSDLTAVRQSFATWENITTANIDFVDDGTTTIRNASATDGINLVSFTDEKFPFPPRVLAIAAKTLQVSPNDDVARIIDADIVINPEFSALSVGVGNGNYYDAQSIITHEIGHVMGLLHTGVVNSTMFFMLGYGTKVQSLEQDDRSWASYKYPGASYNSTFGSISGHISYGYGGYPVAGTHVMAIRTGVANPDTIHSYSDADGNYLVPGLPAGTYNIYIQPLDGNVNGFNLRPGNISTYIYCNTIYTDYPGEFLSTNESATETTDPPLSLSVSAGSNIIAGEITTNRDITSPTLLQVRPTDPDGAKIKVLSNFIIKFSEPVNESTLTGQTCYLELATTSGPKQFGGTFYTLPDSLNIIVFNPDSILRFSKIYSLHLTGGIQDMKGNGLTVPAPVSFTTVDRDLVPPTIKGTYPSSTAENVLVASNVKVMFSEPMNTESLADNFALTWVGGTPAITNKVEGSITWDAEKATLTFTPSQSLGEATNYTITVSTGATDLSANHLTTVNNFTFSTVNVAAPVVKYLGPTNSQTGVTIETPVVADFSEAIDPLSVTSSTFSLRLSGSQVSVTGDFEFLNGNARVVFKPAANLTPGTGYTITLTPGIKDVSPTVSTLAANVTSTFTTAPTPAAPTITFLDPPRGTVKVGTATAVTISGTGFDPSPSKNLILFNGITAFAKTATLNTLTTEVPVGTMSGPVTVTVNGRTSNQMQFDIIPDYMNDPDYATSNKSLPSGPSGGSAVSGSGEAVFAMVTNPENNSVTRIGLGTSGTTATIPVGGLYPVKVDIDQLGKYAYVTNYYSHDVSVINLATNQVFKVIPAGVGPYGVAVTSDGKRVYVSNYESGNLSLIDVDPTSGGFDHVVANVSTGSNPGNIAVTADAGMVLVTGPFGLKIVDSNPKSVDYNSVTATVSSGTKTTDVTVTADAGFAIVATEEGSLLIVNLHPANDDYSGAVVASVPTGTKVSDVKASGDALYVYAIDTENDQILVYKFSGGATGLPSGSGTQGITLTPLDPIPVPDAPSGLNISPAGDKIYTITSLTSTTRQVTTISLTGGIISPEQSIQGLISTIQIMIDNGNIPRVRGAALIVILNSALRNVTAGRTKLAILDLNAFVALVNTYIKNKQVSNTQGKALIDVANVIINQLKGTKSGVEEFNYTDFEQPVYEPVAQTKLGVIYPNPSMDAITIEYEIAENELTSGKVSVQVYDVTGRVVGNLVNETMKPGRYSATWSGCYENGSSVPRGIYFIRFSAGNVREVKQIMLIR